MIDLGDGDSRSAAAGEYVLGTLGAADRAAFELALDRDPALLAEVYVWQDRLLGLSARAEPLPANATLWARIDASTAAPVPAQRPISPRADATRSAVSSWLRRLWQGASLAAVAATIVLAALLVRQGKPSGAGGARYFAVLQDPRTQAAGWVVEVEEGGALRLVPLADPGPVPAGHAWQFWTKPANAAAPTSLGLVPQGRRFELPAAGLPGLGTAQLFEITLEPPNGSPIGRPTGPVLFVGRTVAS